MKTFWEFWAVWYPPNLFDFRAFIVFLLLISELGHKILFQKIRFELLTEYYGLSSFSHVFFELGFALEFVSFVHCYVLINKFIDLLIHVVSQLPSDESSVADNDEN